MNTELLLKVKEDINKDPKLAWVLLRETNMRPLWDLSLWPQKYYDQLFEAERWNVGSNVFCDRIDHFIKTEGRE